MSQLEKVSRIPTIDSIVFNFFKGSCLDLTSPEFQGATPLSPSLPGEVPGSQASLSVKHHYPSPNEGQDVHSVLRWEVSSPTESLKGPWY